MNCPFCYERMERAGLEGANFFCQECGIEYFPDEPCVLRRKTENSFGFKDWEEIPKGCLITVDRFTKELK